MSLSAWLVAALSIIGQLEPAIDALDSVAIVLGGLRLTPLLLIKLGVLLAVALWLTNIASNFVESRITAIAGSDAVDPGAADQDAPAGADGARRRRSC